METITRDLSIQTAHGPLHGKMTLPDEPLAIILLARSHHAPVDALISANLANRGYAILSMDLLTAQEAHFVDATQNVPRLAQRLIDLLDLVRRDESLADLPFAIFATGDASPAAVRAAAQRDKQIHALACHGGLIDRAGKQSLEFLCAPLLMLCDIDDEPVKTSYERSRPYLGAPHEFHQLNPAEDFVLRVAAWFSLHLRR